MEQRLWALKSVENADRALQTVDDYEDQYSVSYTYDSNVKNYKRVTVGDKIILINKKRILGFAQIETIDSQIAEKTIRRCPVKDCGSTTIDSRKIALPKYRCNRGHTFDMPVETVKGVTRYTANYQNSFIPISVSLTDLHQLRPYYTNGYNQNNSMQLLANDALSLFDEVRTLSSFEVRLPPEAALGQGVYSLDYEIKVTDERGQVYRQIRERRGQQKFRNDLLNLYERKCVITGCEIIDLLEAAHISPYRGIKDNHTSNGLLLRADIHTLFDIDLIGIDPESHAIHCNERISAEYGHLEGRALIIPEGTYPSQNALRFRWNTFLSNKEKITVSWYSVHLGFTILIVYCFSMMLFKSVISIWGLPL